MVRRSGSGYRYNAGAEAARKHIEAARVLSQELGGTDEDVKKYFFSLRGAALVRILDQYECEFGSKPREYAEQTMPKWRSGQTKMSGLVAGRLFGLLPRFMPLDAKYEMVKSLWDHVAPSSYKALVVGPDVEQSRVSQFAKDYLLERVQVHGIPLEMERRFDWLASGDVSVRQELLNFLRRIERDTALSLIEERLPVLLAQIRNQPDLMHRLRHTITLGKHRLEIAFDPGAEGLELKDTIQNSKSSSQSEHQWLWWVLGAVALGVGIYLFG